MQQFFFEHGADTIWHLATGYGFVVIDLEKLPEHNLLSKKRLLYGLLDNHRIVFESVSSEVDDLMFKSAVKWYAEYCGVEKFKIMERDPRIL